MVIDTVKQTTTIKSRSRTLTSVTTNLTLNEVNKIVSAPQTNQESIF